MPSTTRTFRIFVSSTFSDLKAERGALQERVFPRLRALAAEHGCRFQVIDLRWGVSEEAALDQQTMAICLGEIERCQKVSPRPNFVILLGNRYGWRPLPAAIPADEFDQLLPLAAQVDQGALLTWYRRDDNALPPVHLLQPRTGEHEAYEAWQPVESRLRIILEGAALQARLPAASLVKYTASATEQEIIAGALQVPDAKEHVFCFLRDIQGLQDDPTAASFRETDPAAAQKQVELKERLRQQLPGNVHDYQTPWQGDQPALEHLDRLCEDVYTDLMGVMLAEIAKIEAVDALEKEIATHLAFGAERAGGFIGRDDFLNKIATYLADRAAQSLVVWGVSGSGKSALLARALQVAQVAHPRAVIAARFIGATPGSSNVRALLEDLCRQLTRARGGDESAVPGSLRELAPFFHRLLAQASAEKPVLLFLDALDQLSPQERASELGWLPAKLPPHVRLVLSTLTGEELQAVKARYPSALTLELTAMQPQEGAAVLDNWLAQAQRRLTPLQRQDILSKFKAGGGLPLYLKLAFEEARRWHSFDGLPALSNDQPGVSPDIPGVLNDLFWRLEQENQHGAVLVGRALGFLAAAKNGLTEDEILELLWVDPAVREDFFRRSPRSPKSITALPVVVWSRLYLDLEPYLAWRQADDSELLGFYHRQLRQAAEQRYGAGERQHALHAHLAAYFTPPPASIREQVYHTVHPFWLDPQLTQPHRRRTSELVFQQARANLSAELAETLTIYDYLSARLAAAGVEALIADYEEYPYTGAGEVEKSLRLIQSSLRLAAHILARDSAQLPTQLVGRLQRFVNDSIEVQGLLSAALDDRRRLWARPLNPCLSAPGGAEMRTFNGHTDEIAAVAILPDGWRALSASWDKSLRLWDLTTGTELLALRGHTDRVCSVTALPDNWRALSGSYDCTIKLWNLDTGAVLRTLSGHKGWVKTVAVLPDGKRFISGASDALLKLWDIETGKELRTFKGHSGMINAVAILPGGDRVLSASDDYSLVLWEIKTGKVLRIFKGHRYEVTAVGILPDGKRALSADYNSEHILWDLENGKKLRDYQSFTGTVSHIAILPDGRRALTPYEYHNFMLWDLETGQPERVFERVHTSTVTAVTLLPDGQRTLSGAADNILKLWNLNVDSNPLPYMGHDNPIFDLAALPDGRRAVSASDDHTLMLWDSESWRELGSFEGHNSRVTAVSVLPDGDGVLSASADKTIILWSIGWWCRQVRTFKGHTAEVTAVKTLPDGKRFLSASSKGEIKLWDIKSRTELSTFSGHTKGISSLSLSPDGSLLLSLSWDQTVRLWQVETGTELRSFNGHFTPVSVIDYYPNLVAIMADNRRVLSGDHNDLRLWDLETGKTLRAFYGHTGEVLAVSLLPDGRRAISVSDDATLKLWDLESGACLCTYSADARLTACAALRETLVCAGDRLGRIHFLEFN